MKKSILLLFLLSGPAVVAASSPTNPYTAFQGFFLGSNIGYGEGGGEKKFIDATTGALEHLNNLGVRGVDGGIGTGYVYRIEKWALGLSFDANWANSQGYHKHLDSSEEITARLNNSLQLYARFGYVFYEDIMPFIGFGWDNSSWTLNSTHTNALNVANKDSTSHRQNGFLWKAGIDFLTLQYLVFGCEYTGTYAPGLNYSYKNEGFLDNWTPQYNKIALTAKVIPFASPENTLLTAAFHRKQKDIYPAGFYLAGNLGYANGVGTKKKFKQGIDDRIGIPNVRGLDGGIGVGYLYPFGAWRIGAAFDSNWSSATGRRKNVTEDRNASTYIDNSLQLYARAGYAFWETILPFIGLGWDNSSWRLDFIDSAQTSKISHRQNALLWKLGVDFALSTHVVCGAEYIGTMASPQMYRYVPQFSDPSTGSLSTFAHSWNPQYNKYAMSLKFFF